MRHAMTIRKAVFLRPSLLAWWKYFFKKVIHKFPEKYKRDILGSFWVFLSLLWLKKFFNEYLGVFMFIYSIISPFKLIITNNNRAVEELWLTVPGQVVVKTVVFGWTWLYWRSKNWFGFDLFANIVRWTLDMRIQVQVDVFKHNVFISKNN